MRPGSPSPTPTSGLSGSTSTCREGQGSNPEAGGGGAQRWGQRQACRQRTHIVVVAPVVGKSERRDVAAGTLGALKGVDGLLAPGVHLDWPAEDLGEGLHLDVITKRAVASLAADVSVEILCDVLGKVVALLLHVIHAQPTGHVVHVGIAIHAVGYTSKEAVPILCHLPNVKPSLRHLLLKVSLLLRPNGDVAVVFVLTVVRLFLREARTSSTG